MGRFAYISQFVSVHDRLFLETIQSAFDEVHLITVRLSPLPEWLSELPKVQVHNLVRPGYAYDDPDEGRYHRVAERLRLSWNLWVYGRCIKTLVRSLNPVMLQGTWIPTDGYLAARCGRHPLILSPLVTDVVRTPQVSRRLFRRVGWTLEQADHIIVDCNWVRDEILNRYPKVSSKKMTVLPRPVDLKMYFPNSAGPTSNDYPPVIICNRYFGEIYDHEILFQALDRLPPEIDYRLWLMNQGPLLEAHKERVRKSKWAEKAEIFGKLPSGQDVAQRLRASHVYVSCARQDGTSASLLEAMASGLPCIVTDLPVNREWIVPGKTGILFPVGNVAALAQNLIELLGEAKIRRALGRKAAESISVRVNRDLYYKTLTGIYNGLLT